MKQYLRGIETAQAITPEMVNFGKSYINSLNADQSKCIIKRKGNCTLTTAAPKD